MIILTIVGARPQFIKAATVSRAIGRWNSTRPDKGSVEEIIVHTGQHYDENMSDVFFRDLDIPSPEYNLGIGSSSHGEQTGRMLAGIEQILLDRHPDCVLVYGDTNSTLAGALAAAKLHIPVAHVEAGLRSFNRRMPEEINRVLTDHISDWLFCPTTTATGNLAREGITDGVYTVGDVMYDGILHYRDRLPKATLNRLGLQPKRYLLATVHRAENTDSVEQLRQIIGLLNELSSPDRPVVLALHPRTKQAIADHHLELAGSVRIVPPVSYFAMIELLANTAAVITDSGGLQKEAYFLKAPCLTLRDETEWTETIACQANRLVGSSHPLASQALAELDAGTWLPDFSGQPYGNGMAADAILAHLAKEG
ncbi:MAG: UDP-N-acetylglucosamine 2-epimerase (non-hydrolyzing) [Betaproteobacteria bacterium]|nr:UDP-N-acetylglucosamine 2-epimerase (non-hydrolyzing) [Betaproteobacteria bacterium]